MYETTTKKDRNEFIIAHMQTGKSLREVRELLIKSGHDEIDPTRVWKIWKKSDQYHPRRAKEPKCSFCLEYRPNISMYSIIKQGKVLAKMCGDCWDKRPIVSTNVNHE